MCVTFKLGSDQIRTTHVIFLLDQWCCKLNALTPIRDVNCLRKLQKYMIFTHYNNHNSFKVVFDLKLCISIKKLDINRPQKKYIHISLYPMTARSYKIYLKYMFDDIYILLLLKWSSNHASPMYSFVFMYVYVQSRSSI